MEGMEGGKEWTKVYAPGRESTLKSDPWRPIRWRGISEVDANVPEEGPGKIRRKRVDQAPKGLYAPGQKKNV